MSLTVPRLSIFDLKAASANKSVTALESSVKFTLSEHLFDFPKKAVIEVARHKGFVDTAQMARMLSTLQRLQGCLH